MVNSSMNSRSDAGSSFCACWEQNQSPARAKLVGIAEAASPRICAPQSPLSCGLP